MEKLIKKLNNVKVYRGEMETTKGKECNNLATNSFVNEKITKIENIWPEINAHKAEENQSVKKIQENYLSLLKRWEVIENESKKMMSELKSDVQSEIQDLKNNQIKISENLSDVNIENENSIQDKNKNQVCDYVHQNRYPFYTLFVPTDYNYKINDIKKVLKEGNWEHISDVFPLHLFPYEAKLHIKATKTGLKFKTYLTEMNGLGESIPSKKHRLDVGYTVASQDRILAQLSMSFSHFVKSHKNIKNDEAYDKMNITKRWLQRPGYIKDDALKISLQVSPHVKDCFRASHDGTVLFSLFNVKYLRIHGYGCRSPNFYTNSYGHLIRACFFMKGFGFYYGKGISMEIAFEKNDFETALLVPSQYQITVTLFNPNDFSKYFVKTERMNLISFFKRYTFNICKNKVIDRLVDDDDRLVCRITIDELFTNDYDIELK